MNEIQESFRQRLRKVMEARGLKPSELSDASGVSRPLISMYLNGKAEAKQNSLYKLATALNVSEAWLMGYDVPMTRGVRPASIGTQKIPLLGEIACGKPLLANEEFTAYVEVGANIPCDFCLRAKGDSMTGARIFDGDIVFIRKQPLVENGEIAAVVIGDEATLKRVYLTDGKLVLQAENPAYAPLVFVGDELNRISIIGKAIAFQSDVR